MRETEKIWMSGELVDWGDAKIHVGAHGLHYGSGVFEGIRCYETDNGPAVFRLTDHLNRLNSSATLLHMELPYSVEELRAASLELLATNGLPECVPAADRVLRLRRARRLGRRQPGRGRDHELAVGRVPRRRGDAHGHPGEGLVLEARRAEHDPARGEGNRHLPELDARRHRGEPGRLRRGDPAHRRRLRRRRLRREHLRRQGRPDHDAAALDVDPARASRATRSSSWRTASATRSWRTT